MVLHRKFLGPLACSAIFGVAGCSGGGGARGNDSGTPDGSDSGFPLDGPIVVHDGGVTIHEDGGGSWTCYVTTCAGHGLECGDCEDNDGDGLVDSHDRECLGPCDDTEGAALIAGVGGETGGECKADCYFDFGNGSGNDMCEWDHRCDPRSIAPTFDPEGPDCEYEESRVGTGDCPAAQSDDCLDFCRPLTPNGCDCFGCCTFAEIADREAGEGGAFVWIGSVVEGTNDGSCTFADVLDTTLCRPCTPVDDCFNDCGQCELCIGRDTVSADCDPPDAGVPDGGYPQRCSPGLQECGLAGEPECPPEFYCISGCCQAVLI